MELTFRSARRISDRLLMLTEAYSQVHRFQIPVITGDEKILVLDAGLGAVPGLRNFIEGYTGTEKPMLCACTHGHPDHTGCANEFDEAFLSPADMPHLQGFALDVRQRLLDLPAFALENAEVIAYCTARIRDNADTKFSKLMDGQIFDLGGACIEAYAMPGHSKGHMMFIDREEKYVFTGDAISTDIILRRLNAEGIRQYAEQIDSFLQTIDDTYTLYPAHLPAGLPVSAAKATAKACREIASGKIQNDPPGESIFRYKAGDPAMRVHYTENAAVIYNRDILHAAG